MREHGTILPGYNLTGALQFVTVYTLFDITRTGVLRSYVAGSAAFIDDADQLVRNQTEWNRSRDQQRNWETVVQLISLRAQPVMLEDPVQTLVTDIHALGLGSTYSAEQEVWVVNFATEHISVFANETSAIGRLLTECNQVPMITGLTETATFSNASLATVGDTTNICFVVGNQLTSNYVDSTI